MNQALASQALLQRAFAAHQSGDLATARAGYQAVLQAQPRNFDALHMLGVAMLHSGDHAEAARLIEAALAVDQNDALAWTNLAAAYRGLARPGDAAACLVRRIALAGEDAAIVLALAELSLAAGQSQAALQHFDRVLALDPRSVAAAVGSGIALRELSRTNEALQRFEQALAIAPADPRAATNLGITLCEQQRHDEALAIFDGLLASEPSHAPAHNARALALWRLGQLADAEQAYDRAIALVPDYADAWSNRGALLTTQGREAEAMRDYQQAIALQPRRAEAHNCLGALLASQHRLDEAIAHYQQAIACRPGLAQAHNNLGVALVEAGRPQEALASYRQALELLPPAQAQARADALVNRANLWARLGRHAEAAGDANAALALAPHHPYALGNALYFELMQCDWRHRAERVAELEARTLAGEPVATPFVALTVSADPALLLRSARQYAAALYAPDPSFAATPSALPASGRIRLAFVGADFHEHATAYLISGLIEHLDKSRFELVALSYGPLTDDRYQRRLKAALDQFHDIRQRTDAQAAQLIGELGVDIAIDLKGYTHNGRPGIFRHRAAPLQLAYLGYPGSSGMAQIDYLVADRITVPHGHEAHYSECIARMPHSYQCNDSERAVAARAFTRGELGLPADGFVFCCFNNGYKITPEVFDTWMRLLRQVDGSVLWLLQDNPAVADNLRREAAAREVDGGRLVFAPRMPPDEHLARQRCADLFVDTWPVNAHTTASDALWAGLPIVTRTGGAFAGRVAASLLHAIGRGDCVADDIAGYEALALALARDPARLAALKAALLEARRDAPLFDTRGFAQDLGRAFEHMQARQQAGLAPESFDLPAR